MELEKVRSHIQNHDTNKSVTSEKHDYGTVKTLLSFSSI